MKNSKLIQTLQELAQNLRADYYYFVSPISAGDTYYLCALKRVVEKQLQGKIIFVVKPTHKAVCDMFDAECIICEVEIIDIFRHYKCLENDAVVSVPTLCNLYPAHTISLQKISPHRTMLEMYLNFFDLPKDIKGDLPTNLPKISESLRAKLDKIAPLNQIILFCPEANSCECLPPIIFKYECDRLLRQGYKIIVNCGFVSSVHFKRIDYTKHLMYGVYNLDLSLKDTIALALSCAGVISTRSGFCDIIAPHCENLTIYYTNFYYWWQGNLKEINARRLPKEVLIYDTPIYKRYLRAKRKSGKSLPMKLYKRYATKGFLRKLRLPFTAYFKIYRRHKNGALQDFGAINLALKDFSDKEMSEFIEQELMQTYEYNLGLALQKACEWFWWGGFLLFPLDYLKIRKEKGRGLVRISSVIH